MTLRELAKRARIAESTLHGYLRSEGDRIPVVGRGRKRRYPDAAVAVVRQMRQEHLRRQKKQRDGYYSLKEISRLTGISQTTLQKYQKEHAAEIPAEGQGRRRMYPREAVRLFRRYRQASRRGPQPRNDLAQRIESLERAQRRTRRLLLTLLKKINH